MANCGSLNPQEQLKKHINNTPTLVNDALHADPHLSQPKFRGHRQDDSTADFARFNSSTPLRVQPSHSYNDEEHRLVAESEFISAKLAQRAHTPVDPAGYSGRGNNLTHDLSSPNRRYLESSAAAGHALPVSVKQGTPPDQWAQEFNSLNVRDGLDQPQRTHVLPQGFNHHHPQFVAPADTVPARFARGSLGQIPPYQRSNAANDSAFEAAFVNVEKNLQNLDNKPLNQAEADTLAEAETQGNTRGRGGEASIIAERIMRQVSSRSSPDLMEKMKGSQFMTLMNKMRTNEIRLDSETNKLVDKNGEVDVYDIIPDSSHDWPPQRKSMSPATVEQPTTTRAETPKRQEEIASSQQNPRQKYQGTAYREDIMGLDDPDTYFQKVQKSLHPKSSTVGLKFDSFPAAEKLGEISLNQKNWEENYDEWN